MAGGRMENYRAFLKKLQGDESEFSLRHRFLNLALFFCAVGGLLASLINLVIGLGLLLYLAPVVNSLFVLFLFKLSRVNKIQSGIRWGFFVSSSILMSLIWIYNGGSQGTIFSFYLLMVNVFVILTEGRERFFYLILLALNVIVLLTIEYLNPEWIRQYPSNQDKYLDLLLSVPVVIYLSVVINSFMYKNYKVLNQRNEDSNKKLTAALKEIREDLVLARNIQKGILPSENLKIKGLDLAFHYYPLSEIGGDFFHISEIQPGVFRFFLADATGHGIQAALITMALKYEYERLNKPDIGIGELLTEMNEEFINKYRSGKIFFSAFIVDVHIHEEKLEYSSAGHTDQILLPKDSPKIVLPRSGGIMGLSRASVYRVQTHAFKTGDRLFLFTDGLFEEFNEGKEFYGEERIYTFLEDSKKKVHEIATNLILDLDYFTQFTGTQDDITMIFMENEGL